MKVLMTADAVGGVWTYALELARALDDYEVEVVLATMGEAPTAEQKAEVDELRNVDLRVSDYRLEWMENPWQDVAYAGEWLLRVADSVRPDIVHLNGFTHGNLPWTAPALIVGHSCVHSWWHAVKGEPAPKRWDRYSHEIARGLHAVPLVVAPTKAMMATFERQYGSFGAVRVIPNGRNDTRFAPGDKLPMILTEGMVWDDAKNVVALTKIAPCLRWPLYAAGDAGLEDCASMEDENIRYLGKVAPQAMPAWYARASIFALPAKYEPFGLSALEAGLAECALVLGDIPTYREIWGDAAFFVPPTDTTAIGDAINQLADDDRLRTDYAQRARERAMTFTPRRMAEGYLEAYQDIQIEVVMPVGNHDGADASTGCNIYEKPAYTEQQGAV